MYFLDFRGDLEERLDGPGSEVGEVLGEAARRGVGVFGLLWRSQPKALQQSRGGERRVRPADRRGRRAGAARRPDPAGGQPSPEAGRGASSRLARTATSRSSAASTSATAATTTPSHAGDPQVMDFPDAYGPRPPWHDIQAEVRGPAVHDLEHTFRERWYGSSVLDLPSPVRQLYDRAYHMGAMTAGRCRNRRPTTRPPRGTPGGPGAAHLPGAAPPLPVRAARRAQHRARVPQGVRPGPLPGLPGGPVPVVAPGGRHIAAALRDNPSLRVIVVVPALSRQGRPDHPGAGAARARRTSMRACAAAGGDRFAVYDLENHEGTPVYVHAKVVVVDDVWAMVGSDNLNRRSWSHDSELSIAVLDAERDAREPSDPAGPGRRGAGVRPGPPAAAVARAPRPPAERHRGPAGSAGGLRGVPAAGAGARRSGIAGGGSGRGRPAGCCRISAAPVTPAERLWAGPLYRMIYDPDGRPWRDRLRGRL